ncbi:MAG TPA: cytochrome P450 [Anaeromyxobacteraceae bacterium]|nr:cytochrome P450 [Anaeromyxobacteraceae bacterium]
MTRPDGERRQALSDWVPIGTVEGLVGPGPFPATAAGENLVLVRSAAGLRAFEGRCPHQGALLADGEVEGTDLVCSNHRWRFDLDTGQRRGGSGCLRPCPLELRDGTVFVRPAALSAAGPPAAGLRTLADLPGPRRLPLFGNPSLLALERLHATLERWAARFGHVYRANFGPRPMIVVDDAALIQQVLRDRPETFRRLGTIEPVFRELGINGVFSAEGVDWRPLRRLTLEALAPGHLRSFYPTLRRVAERLRRRWLRAAVGRAIDLEEDFKRLTVDLTTQLAFGHDLDTLDDEGDVLQRKLEHVFPGITRRLFASVPWWRLVRLPAERRLERAVHDVLTVLRALLAETRERLATDPARAANPRNFLEAMIAARDQAGRPFSDAQVLGNAVQILLAGEDTTALTLSWAVHELCDAPDSQAAIAAEADAMLGDSTTPADFETASRLEVAGAVAQEAMRLRPVAPILIVEANRDTVLGDVAIPPGQSLCLLMRRPATSAAHFAEPGAFRPERWLREVGGRAHEPSAHMPFGSGPRICPGRSLALLEMRVTLATLYRNFTVERVGNRDRVAERFAFTMAPVGLRVRLTPRRLDFPGP